MKWSEKFIEFIKVHMKSVYLKLLFIITAIFLSACQMSATKSDLQQDSAAAVNPETMQMYQYALKLMELGNDDAAIKVFNGVSKLNDALSGPYVNRGLIYLKLGDKDKAEKSFKDAISRNAQNVTALNQFAVLLREKKDFNAAKLNYEAALSVDENHVNTHLNFGILCDIYLQDKQCAMDHYQAYQRLKSDETIDNWILDLKERL